MRRSGRGACLFGMVLMMLVLLVAACGGSDDDTDASDSAFPTYSGAEELGSAIPPREQLDNLGVALSAPGASLSVTGDGFDEVGTYFTEAVKDEGWVVPLTSPISDAATVSIMHRDKAIASVMVLKGSMAKMVETAITSQGLDFDVDSIDDNDVVILESHFTCDEADVQDCLDALTATAGS